MSKSGPTRYRVPAALFLHHVQGHDRIEGWFNGSWPKRPPGWCSPFRVLSV